jgi:LacI family transcriptional regulator
MPNIADVAAAAGVSKATVSRVLSGSPVAIRPETREKVQKAVAELGFRPSSVARSLSVRRTFTVGVLVSDIGNPFYSDVIHGIEDAGLPKGYSFFLGNTNFDLPRGTDLIHSLIDRRVDGVIILFSRASDAWLTTLARHSVPASVVNWDSQLTLPETVAIDVDFRPGIQAAVEHLMALGHKHFAHVSGPLDLHTSRQRRDVYLEALAARGIDSSQVTIVEGDYYIEGGRSALRTLLKAKVRPTAVFAANDLMAIGVMGEARAQGLVVPGDLSVVGLDDVWLAAQTDPPLTTVAMPRYEIGFQAMQRLLELIEPGGTRSTDPLATRLVVRESTAPPR